MAGQTMARIHTPTAGTKWPQVLYFLSSILKSTKPGEKLRVGCAMMMKE
jgi:hypothetical protein